jgi:NLR family CARD domain-containing protein 3
VVALGAALESNTSLIYLSLHFNRIGADGAASLLKALVEGNITLTQLDLWSTGRIQRTVRCAITAFVNANRAGIRLLHAGAELDLSSEGIVSVQAKRVAMELEVNMTVTRLILSKNRIGDKGCMDMANALTKNRVLTTIELSNNRIGYVGCEALATTLRENTVLTKILLNGNKIGPAGAIALAEMLRISASLQELGLGRNNVGSEGAMAIADALKCNVALERLDLDDNGIGCDGAMAILKVLQHFNRTLTSLSVEGNAEISLVLLESLDSHLVVNLFLKHLHNPLEDNVIPLAIHAVLRGSIFNKEAKRSQSQEVTNKAGLAFHLVKATAL